MQEDNLQYSNRQFVPKIYKCRLCNHNLVQQYYPCKCQQPVHKDCLKNSIYLKLQYDSSASQKVIAGISKSRISCEKCSYKIPFICICEDVKIGIADCKYIVAYRKLSIIMTVFILLIIWGSLLFVIIYFEPYITPIFSPLNFFIFLGYTLLGLFVLAMTIQSITSLFSKSKKVRARIQLDE